MFPCTGIWPTPSCANTKAISPCRTQAEVTGDGFGSLLKKGDLHGVIALRVSWWEYVSSAKAALFLWACYFIHCSFFKHKVCFPPHQNVCEAKQTFFCSCKSCGRENFMGVLWMPKWLCCRRERKSAQEGDGQQSTKQEWYPSMLKKHRQRNTEPRNSKRNKFSMDPFITRRSVCSAGNESRHWQGSFHINSTHPPRLFQSILVQAGPGFVWQQL